MWGVHHLQVVTKESTLEKQQFFAIRKYESEAEGPYAWAVFKVGEREPIIWGCTESEARFYANALETIDLRERASQ
jgi:hypothetical protein